MLQNCSSRRESSASDISLLVESALECFDFLSAECDDIDDDDDEYYPEVSISSGIHFSSTVTRIDPLIMTCPSFRKGTGACTSKEWLFVNSQLTACIPILLTCL